jgi:excisionase family DNA binding protein
MSRQDVLGLPAVMSVDTAAEAWGISKAAAYDMIRRGTCPFRTVPVGRWTRVLRADLLESLRIRDHD